jgi:uncharacterized protein (TIGR02145 family)
MNKFKTLLFLTVFGGIGLWGCDDSSSASEGNNETSAVESSSSVKDSDSTEESSSSIDKKSSGNESMEKDKSSSSAKGSEPVEVSSSSAKETKDSSDSKSSSSVKTSDSSSSNKDKSSSSVNSSSSNKQSSSSVKSSSSSVKQSSSSVASSSSFVRWGDLPPNFSYGEFEYEQRIYKYLTVTGKDTNNKTATIDVMAENLNVGEMVDGDKDQNNDSKIERYCYDNDTTNCQKYGGLYQWAEAMKLSSECNAKSCADSIKPNHQGICPDGWRLLTYNDFYIVVHADGNDAGVKGVRSTGFGGLNYTGYSLIGAGYLWNYGFTNLNETTYWHYPEEAIRGGDINVKSFSGRQNNTSTAITSQDAKKTHGFSVRCVKISK